MCFKINKQIIYFKSRASHYVIFEMADRQKSRKSGLRLMLSLTEFGQFFRYNDISAKMAVLVFFWRKIHFFNFEKKNRSCQVSLSEILSVDE